MMRQTVRIYDYDHTLGDTHKCPECGRRNKCRTHRYVYKKWYVNYRDSMLDRASRHPDLFPATSWGPPSA